MLHQTWAIFRIRARDRALGLRPLSAVEREMWVLNAIVDENEPMREFFEHRLVDFEPVLVGDKDAWKLFDFAPLASCVKLSMLPVCTKSYAAQQKKCLKKNVQMYERLATLSRQLSDKALLLLSRMLAPKQLEALLTSTN